MNEPLDLSSGRFVNESAIKSHALRCSKQFRAGKFTRVGQDFLDEVKADVEASIRALRNQCTPAMNAPLEPDENVCCITGALNDKVSVEWNRLICRIIQNKVQRQPTVGVTLSRTR
jgi:hypothetical protein